MKKIAKRPRFERDIEYQNELLVCKTNTNPDLSRNPPIPDRRTRIERPSDR